MKRSFLKLSVHLMLIIVFPFAALSQDLNWDLNLSKPRTFTSLNPSDDPGVTQKEMWQVSMRNLMNFAKNPASAGYGINAALNDLVKGSVKVSVYLYDETVNDEDENEEGRGPLIFQCYMDTSNEDKLPANSPNKYELGDWLAWWPDTKEDRGFYFNAHWSSNDARSSILAAAFYDYNKKFQGWNFANTDGTAIIPYAFLNANEDYILPVIIEVTIYKANVKWINLPGIGTIEPAYFKPPNLDIKATITTVNTDNVHLDVAIPTLVSEDKISVSDFNIKLWPFGDTVSAPLASYTIKQIPYVNDNFILDPSSGPLAGEFWIWASYTIDITDKFGQKKNYNRMQFLANFANSYNTVLFPTVYTISKVDYPESKVDNYPSLPVFKLNGGMSAEYGVEKSVASLSSGISETWDPRLVDGKPDLKDGGPVSIYPDPNKFDFLDQSVKQTVKVYNDNLGATTPFNTVIIGTGIAHVPYLSNAMKAPFLPLHFLVSVHSVAEIQQMLNTAKTQDYSAFSMMGYDPSVPDIGVAWIKLRELPPAYKQFLIDHKVQNVIIMGYNEGVGGGEGGARRILIEGQSDEEFSEGSMYMMGHGPLSGYKGFYKDFYRWNFGDEKALVDWEGGITNNQVQNLSSSLKKGGFNPYTIRADESFDFYRWATDIQLYLLEKNKQSPQKISMNEYLIGFPEYELYTSTVPYLYWQGLAPGQIAFNAFEFTDFKVSRFYHKGPFRDIPVYIQAKANRSLILDSLKKNYFTNVTMDTWQQADVWDPSDGMNAPCELIAVAITTKPDGAQSFAEWNKNRAVFDFDDFNELIRTSIKPPPSDDPKLFPAPAAVDEVMSNAEAGLNITKYLYDPNTYWQPLNFPNNIEMRSFSNGYPGNIMGYLDGQLTAPDMRKQSITIAEYDLDNQSTEYSLEMGYKFNVTDKEGLLSYNPALGDQQDMDCFEFTSIPYNHWFDIPNRMMARKGAVWIVNGGVYDFDYNGLPGVVPFIKKFSAVKAQPQVLSFKGEAGFGWTWGSRKKASIFSRPKDIPATGLVNSLKTLFHDKKDGFDYVMGAMTFMSGKGLYDITALQPDWMKNYPPFPSYYLQRDNRCFFAPTSLKCVGTEVVAPIDEGWNNCDSLKSDKAVQRFSALAYQQFPRTFDEVANARTFVAIKGNKLDIGIIDGDYGKSGYRGPYVTKTLGMHVYEESQFRLARGYDQFVNLDGGSSTQMWLNGRGPLQMMNSYILMKDNQGPYYSRLLSSFIMLIPYKHKELINSSVQLANVANVPVFDNSHINFDYSDQYDLNKDKAFIDLSPCADSLNKTDGSYGLIAGNFSGTEDNASKNGGILFYTGEDMFYPETKGLDTVHPRLRNLMVVGVGLVLPSLIDSLIKLPVAGTDPEFFRKRLRDQKMSAYYIKVFNGEIIEFLFNVNGKAKYLKGNHRFYIRADGQSSTVQNQNIFFAIDGNDLHDEPNTYYYFPELPSGFLNMGVSTHAYIGALNLDGRFLTGDIKLKTFNYLFAVGKDAWKTLYDYLGEVDQSLSKQKLPELGDFYFKDGIFALQCLETTGQHAFALSRIRQPRFYGLRVNNFVFNKNKPTYRKPAKAKAK